MGRFSKSHPDVGPAHDSDATDPPGMTFPRSDPL